MPDLPRTYAQADGWTRRGRVTGIAAHCVVVSLPGLMPGALVALERVGRPVREPALVEACTIEGDQARCIPVTDLTGVVVGAAAESSLERAGIFAGPALLGAAVDAWGRGAHGGPPFTASVEARDIQFGERAPVQAVLRSGVPAIDALLTFGHGQRVALLSGSGVGKTTLLERIMREARVDARVVALVGERGREASETIARLAGSQAWRATTVVCATADAPPVERFAAARTATAQAEALAVGGRSVLLAVDSLTRVANAWRELALATGEPAVHRGYPASLAGALARLVERAGARRCGCITALYAVLVDGDDLSEPVTDCLRSLLDGHIVLSRALANAGRFPPIDVLRSVSRTFAAVAGDRQRADAHLVRRALATLEAAEDLIAIGAYQRGTDSWLDACVAARADIEALVFDGGGGSADAVGALARVADSLRAGAERPQEKTDRKIVVGQPA